MSDLDQLEYYEHEALDRTSIVLSMVDVHLLEHPYFHLEENKGLLEKVGAASELLADVYQLIGDKHL